jgi:hypothetical protein
MIYAYASLNLIWRKPINARRVEAVEELVSIIAYAYNLRINSALQGGNN